MRTLVPAETLVYLETNDLAGALQPIVDAKPFVETAKSKPDLSALKGIQLAVAVTGFETKEEVLTDEQSVGRIQPRFVAVADTHTWNYQAVAFAETKLGQFVTDLYGTDVTEERADTANGKELTWISADGRKSYALVTGSVIYFTNDETAIEKCLAVKRGEADSILKTDKIKLSEPGTLARGYVTTDGVAQIANIVGLKFATEASEESEIRSAIAGIVPKLIRGTITDVTWTMTSGEKGIDDKYQVGMPVDVANVLNETMVTGGDAPTALFSKLMYSRSATRYNLKNPQVAVQSVFSIMQKDGDTFSRKLASELLSMVFEPYGVRDADAFLSSIDSNLVTANIVTDEEYPFCIVTAKDLLAVQKSLDSDLKPVNPNFWRSDEDDISVVFKAEQVVVGGSKAIARVFDHGGDPALLEPDATITLLIKSKAPISTVGHDRALANQIVDVFGLSKSNDATSSTEYFTETRFTKSGMERRTISDFGLIGQILAQLSDD